MFLNEFIKSSLLNNKIYGFLIVDIQSIGTTDIISYKFNGIDTSLVLDGGGRRISRLENNIIQYINIKI
jgi:hypothetical protein